MNMLLASIWLVQAQSSSGASEWFNKETLFTAAGSTAAVIAITTVLQRLWTNFPAKWFGLGFSLVLAIAAIGVHQQDWGLINIVVAVINGFITYAAAVGVNTVSTAAPGVGAPAAPGPSYRWWT